MDEKRPIDQKRDSSGVLQIGTDEDGAIIEMIIIDNKTVVVKEKSIYEIIMADTIDPGRTNIGLPTMIPKLIIDKGAESEIVGKTFLTARMLFKSMFFDKTINIPSLLKLSLDLLMELAILDKVIYKYLEDERNAIAEYENRKINRLPYLLPTIIDLFPQCKTIFQIADHIEQILMEMILVFYPNKGLNKQSHFPGFYEVLSGMYGVNDPFSVFIDRSLQFMKVVRESRNALDHRLKYIKVFNFDLQANSSIISPSIELNHKDIKQPRIALSTFFPIILENFPSMIEDIFSFLAAKNATESPMYSQIKEIPEEQRIYKYVRWAFWGKFIDDGYFYQ